MFVTFAHSAWARPAWFWSVDTIVVDTVVEAVTVFVREVVTVLVMDTVVDAVTVLVRVEVVPPPLVDVPMKYAAPPVIASNTMTTTAMTAVLTAVPAVLTLELRPAKLY